PQHPPLLSTIPRPPSSTLSPYTTLFRSTPETARCEATRCGPVARLPRVRRPAQTAGSFDENLAQPLDNGEGRGVGIFGRTPPDRSEEHTSELQSRENLVCRLLLEKKKKK